MCSSPQTCGEKQQSGKLGSRCQHNRGSHTRLVGLLTSSFSALQRFFFFVQLDRAATRGHHEITALVIVKIMDGEY